MGGKTEKKKEENKIIETLKGKEKRKTKRDQGTWRHQGAFQRHKDGKYWSP